ncbi:hypothetical protein Tco_0893840 [Tanacetum coccineum]|uniref:Uncharacterized protein n=1 Tax=Tanacetum coccineum TaxID=301880 RepID=A0ABQ5CBB5_9ASTR
MARLVRLEELCVAANSRSSQIVLVRDLFIAEMELLSGSLVASSRVEFFKKLQQCDQLKLMELVKLIPQCISK